MLKESIYLIIRNDIKLRELIAESLNIKETSVKDYAREKVKSKKLEDYRVVKIISDYTKFSEEELFVKSYCWDEDSIRKRCDKQCEQCKGQIII